MGKNDGERRVNLSVQLPYKTLKTNANGMSGKLTCRPIGPAAVIGDGRTDIHRDEKTKSPTVTK